MCVCVCMSMEISSHNMKCELHAKVKQGAGTCKDECECPTTPPICQHNAIQRREVCIQQPTRNTSQTHFSSTCRVAISATNPTSMDGDDIRTQQHWQLNNVGVRLTTWLPDLSLSSHNFISYQHFLSRNMTWRLGTFVDICCMLMRFSESNSEDVQNMCLFAKTWERKQNNMKTKMNNIWKLKCS